MLRIDGLKEKEFISLMGPEIAQGNLKLLVKNTNVFFKRSVFFVFKSHRWENNHRLILHLNNFYKNQTNLSSSDQRIVLLLIDKLQKRKVNQIDLQILQNIKNGIVKQNPKIDDLPDKEPDLHKMFIEDYIKGRKKFREKGEKGLTGCSTPRYNFLLTEFLENSDVTYQVNLIRKPNVYIGNRNIQDDKAHDDKASQIVRYMVDLKDVKSAYDWAYEEGQDMQQANEERMKMGLSPFAKWFFPIKAFGNHGILAVIETTSDEPLKAKITLIDSFGKNSGYSKCSKAVVKGFKKAFSSSQTTSVYNEIVQQSDGSTCGYHQLLNIRDLTKISNIQEYVAQGKLTPRTREELTKIVLDLAQRD